MDMSRKFTQLTRSNVVSPNPASYRQLPKGTTMTTIQENSSITIAIKMTALLVLGVIALLAFGPAFAADAIPAVREGSETVLATIRIAAPIIAIVIFIGACVMAMVHKIGIGHLLVIFVACVGIGAAEPIIRFAISLGASS